jgi:hypothetical protein
VDIKMKVRKFLKIEMKTIKLILIASLVLPLIIILGLYIYFNFFYKEPEYIQASDILEGVEIQPQEALNLAQPYLEEYATFTFKEEVALEIHIVRYKKNYYIKKTNYPAKYVGYYMKNAIKINALTGEVSYNDKILSESI